MTSLSIIIPCYNCENTLRDAVSSCYQQGFSLEEFEVVLVDDASTDSTHHLIASLAAEYSNIVTCTHAQNKGGGAARNTAAEAANSDTIFCLDSDDILPRNILPKMMKLLEQDNLDGVVFAGARSFKSDPKKYVEKNFALGNSPIKGLDVIFSRQQWGVGANFLYTRTAYKKCGGYPEYHHFDTQGFGARFLSKGFQAKALPNSYFYQRQFAKKLSYFEQIHNEGEYALNYFFIFNEIAPNLSEEILETLYSTNLFKHTHLSDPENILERMRKFYQKNPEGVFTSHPSSKFTSVFEGNKALLDKRYSKAIELYLKNEVFYPNIYLLASLALSAHRYSKFSVKSLRLFTSSFVLQNHTLRPSWFSRLVNKFKKITKSV